MSARIASAYESFGFDDDYAGCRYAEDERHGPYRRDGFYGRPDGGWDRVIGGIVIVGRAPVPRPTGYQLRGGALDEHGRLRPEIRAQLRQRASDR